MQAEHVQRLETVVVRLEALVDGHDDHEARIRSLEQYRWIAAGAVALAMFLLAYTR